MPIALTTAFDPGSFDEGNSYSQAKILRIEVDVIGKRADIIFAYGDTPESDFKTGPAARKERVTVTNAPGNTDFDDLVTQATLDGETVWDAVKRVCYSHLQTVEPTKLAGTVS